MRMMTIAAVVATTLALTGCKYELATELYLSDIQALAGQAGKPTTAAARIRAQVPAKQTCDEQGGEITKALTGAFQNLRDARCEAEGMNAYYTASADIPIRFAASPKDVSPQTGSIMSFSVLRKEDARLSVVMLIQPTLVQDLRSRMKRRFLQDLPVEDLRLKLIVNNDSQGEALMIAQSAFVNGSPAVLAAEFKVPRRDKLEIVLSDVATAHVATVGTLPVLGLMDATK